jgi:hypothetical protein
MQKDVDTVTTAVPIRILGVNQAGLEAGNAGMCAGRTLPWLQDSTGVDVWKKWQVTFRDVVVLDAENKVLRTYNLTVNDLSNPAKYAELKRILLDAAAAGRSSR